MPLLSGLKGNSVDDFEKNKAKRTFLSYWKEVCFAKIEVSDKQSLNLQKTTKYGEEQFCNINRITNIRQTKTMPIILDLLAILGFLSVFTLMTLQKTISHLIIFSK